MPDQPEDYKIRRLQEVGLLPYNDEALSQKAINSINRVSEEEFNDLYRIIEKLGDAASKLTPQGMVRGRYPIYHP